MTNRSPNNYRTGTTWVPVDVRVDVSTHALYSWLGEVAAIGFHQSYSKVRAPEPKAWIFLEREDRKMSSVCVGVGCVFGERGSWWFGTRCDWGMSGVAPLPRRTPRLRLPKCDKKAPWRLHCMISGGIRKLLVRDAVAECSICGQGPEGLKRLILI